MPRKRVWPWVLSLTLVAGLAVLVVVLVERGPGGPGGAGSGATSDGEATFEAAATVPVMARTTRPEETERSDLVRPDVTFPSLAGKVLGEHEVAPSASPTTLELPGHLSVTVPAGLLSDTRRLVVSEVPEPPPAAFPWLRQAPVYDVTLGDMHELAKPIDVTLPFDPSWLVDGVPPEAVLTVVRWDPSQGVWVELPSRIDLDRHTMTARTDHLSAFSIQVWRGDDRYLLFVDGDFQIYYDHQEVRGLTVPRFPRDGGPAPTLPFDDEKLPASAETLPGYIAVVRDAARKARDAYRAIGLELRTRPLHIYVGGTGSSAHSSVTNNLTITCQALDEEELRYAVAHEMFHNVQARYYTTAGIIARRWWMEATAEYAAARVAVPGYRNMGKLNEIRDGRIPARFLEQYLTYAPSPKYEFVGKLTRLVWGDDAFQYHAYQGAYFIEFLARLGAEAESARRPSLTDTPTVDAAHWFADMFKAVATAGLETMPALDDFLVKEVGLSNNLASRYDQFVLYYLFDPSSPMPKDATDPARVDAAALDRTSTMAPDGTPFTHPFTLVGGHSAKVWEVLAPAAVGQTRKLAVDVDGDLPGYVTVYVVKLHGGRRRAGVAPEATFDHGPRKLRRADVELGADDRLYLVAVNDYFGSESVSLRVSESRPVFEQATLELALQGAADVLWGDGRPEAGSWRIDLQAAERPLQVRDRDYGYEVHIDKPRDEKIDLTLAAHADPYLRTLKVDLTIDRTFESFDDSGQDPRITGGGKQRCQVKDVELALTGTFAADKGRTRWVYSGQVPASKVTDYSHTSHRNAVRLDGDPVPALSFTKTGKSFLDGTLKLELYTVPVP